MSDIFLSYVLDDLEKAEKLRHVFERQGWTVWWNPFTAFNGLHAEAVDRELKKAKIIVALWSRRAARRSSFVRETLHRISMTPPVLVLLDRTKRPLPLVGFDLSAWDGDPSHTGLASLMSYVRGIIGAAAPPAGPPASFAELSLSEITENAMRAIQESMGSQPGGETRFSGIFISYRRSEAAAYAGRLYDRLAERFGKEKVFIDTENVGWGEDFVEAITEAAESCAVMIVLVSPRWSRGADAELNDYVRLEVAKALGRKIRVIPILIQGASMPAAKELPEDIAPLVRRNALALSDTRWERDVEDLIESLEILL